MFKEDLCGSEIRDGQAMVVTKAGKQGHAVFGQYVTLPPGDYAVDFTLALADATDGAGGACAVLDVVANWGSDRLARVGIGCDDLSTAFKTFRLDFSTPVMTTVEFRVEIVGARRLAVLGEPVLTYHYAPMISYAHAREDIYLWRALAPRVHHSVGFWIDAGAFDPVIASVTKAFSDRGWRGVNIEPLKGPYDRLVQQRSRDVNLQVLVSDVEGSETFHELDNGQLSTTNDEFAKRHVEAGADLRTYEVKATTLSAICHNHAPEEIHFLKIDVEGHETKAVKGMDFERFRPWILILEATEPNQMDKPTHEEWEPFLVDAGYDHVRTDLPNRYYVAREHPELREAFAAPADDFVPFSQLQQFRASEERLAALNDRIRHLENEVAERAARPSSRRRWLPFG